MALTFVSRAAAVPVPLVNPARFQSAAHAHTAGNLLVAVFQQTNTTIATVTNTAGDTWVRTTHSPFVNSTTHNHEIWYVLSTKGNAADVLTFTCVNPGGGAELLCVVYEFAPSNVPGPASAQYVADAAAVVPVDGNNPPVISSGVLPVTQASMLVATYRDSLGVVPTAPSGVQSASPNSGGVTSYYDCYQVTGVPAAVTAVAGANNTFPQWTILAAAFTEIVAPPPPPPPPPNVTPTGPLTRTWGYASKLPAAPNTTFAPLVLAPGATITVFAAGTQTLVLLYADANIVTPLANPLVADINGYFEFYCVRIRIDVQFSGLGIPIPYTLSDYQTIDVGAEL